MPGHILGHNKETTPVGIYFRYKIGPLEANDVVYVGRGNQLLRICLFEYSLAPIVCFNLLMACLASHWAITMQQHRLALYKIGPLEANDDIYCGKFNRLVRICLFECSLDPISCCDLLTACLATHWAMTMQQHRLATILGIRSVH
jgi:hypothetical protein